MILIGNIIKLPVQVFALQNVPSVANKEVFMQQFRNTAMKQAIQALRQDENPITIQHMRLLSGRSIVSASPMG